MGMAASQARYLALVARKSNCEYEGQQINQARTVLSNQTANLFNQMLGLSVPVPPSTSDYTTTQYSFSDGTYTVTMDSWNQLATPEEDYNYVVTYHYNANVYTGAQKKMNDPQVQFSGSIPTDSSQYGSQILSIEEQLKDIAQKQNVYDTKLAAYKTKLSEAGQLSTYADSSSVKGVTDCTENGDGSYTVKKQDYTDDGYPKYTYDGTEVYLKDGKYYDNSGSEVEVTNSQLLETKTTSRTYTPYSSLDETVKTNLANAIEQLKDYGALDEDFSAENVYYDTTNQSFVFKSDLDALVSTGGSGTKTILPQYYIADTTGMPETCKSVNTEASDVKKANIESDVAKNALVDAEEKYKTVSVPDYIGNCQLTALSELSEDQMAEIAQVIKDMKAQDVDTNITRCFNTTDETYSSDTYSGGIYSFKLNGVTYYTTYYDLAESAASGNGINNIDDQDKLAYYNASYVSTKIEKTEKALLETDGNGRFTSIRLGDDTVTYTLSTETVTDDNAYQDAMNEYYYENAQYDKMVQDINAKTSLIQQEDQQLELRLKQLDTEQNALSTEIDAVSKVVKDNIEKSFKTFSG